MKRLAPFARAAAGPAAALILSFGVGAIFISAIGRDPAEVFARFLTGTLGSSYAVGQVLFKATPLMFTGLAAAICFRAGLFNIGAEGQLTVGAFLAAMAGAAAGGGPAGAAAAIAAGAAGGALWGAVPGYLKARFGSHEVINTIMMNFIAAGIVSWFVTNLVGVPATVHTPEIAASLPRLEALVPYFRGSPANASLFLALAACLGAGWFLRRTRRGFELRTIGLSPAAAEYGGIDIGRNVVLAFAASGACAGLAGTNFVLGYKHYFELGFSEGTGFIGIAVALLAKNSPAGVILTSLFFGLLEYGSLTINTLVPKELSNIMQAIVILFMITVTTIIDGRLAAGDPGGARP